MSLWSEQSDDDDFFSEESFRAFKREHDEEMKKLLQFIEDNKAKNPTTESVQPSTPVETLPPIESATTERFTRVSKKKQWKQHIPLNK